MNDEVFSFIQSMMEPYRFQVTQQHITLLRAANVNWDDCEFGAPSIDCKRPYGNSDVYGDIAKILGITSSGDAESFTPEQIDLMHRLHQETEIALQIFLATGEMRLGRYKAERYTNKWEPEW